MRSSLIEKFAPALCDPRPPVVRDPRLLMDASGDVKIYYVPFEYINPSARIVLVGITPGPIQMVNANNGARRVRQAGRCSAEAMETTKSVVAFVAKQPDQPAQPMGLSRLARPDRFGRRVLHVAPLGADHLPPALSGELVAPSSQHSGPPGIPGRFMAAVPWPLQYIYRHASVGPRILPSTGSGMPIKKAHVRRSSA